MAHLREKLPKEKIEPEYRHLGTTTDIYVKQDSFFGSSEVFVELKRNLQSKAQLDRLVGQVEALEPKKNAVLLILCGETNPALLTRLKERYLKSPSGHMVIGEGQFHIIAVNNAAIRFLWDRRVRSVVLRRLELCLKLICFVSLNFARYGLHTFCAILRTGHCP
jgi:hypothetical protein